YAFTPVRARFTGIELEGGARVLDGARKLDLDSKLDSTRATNLDTGEPLPRIAPLRVSLGATLTQGPWSARAEVERAARQSRVPADDTATGGYTLVNLSASYKLKLGDNEGLLFAKLTNVGNTLAYNASTIATVRALSPLPGRGLMAGLRITF
ncbi:MAG TPA: TonB-dependent receptor, partial [Burkholderiaceae bacterium]|nr:TonB-dependent receptor [Burkholderiaceae bacterium]